MSSPASAPATGVKVASKFAAKSGFVIPKNKLSGSLVPIFTGANKTNKAADTKEAASQAHRKTKWGPDLTQDVVVRRGRALAYQTRVDQITKQLESGVLESEDNEDSQVADQHLDTRLSSPRARMKNSELLELEKREVIGEILKLNPSYKAPPDYKPLLKEARVPIPVKEYPGYNFIGLILGSGNETQKRLEKETGAKVKVIGSKSNTEKVEISSSDQSQTQSTYEELSVLVTADTFEKVDAAVFLIELLLNSVSEKLESANNANVMNPSHEVPTFINQGLMPPSVGPTLISQQGQFQYQNPWFPAIAHQGAVNPTSGLIPQTSSVPTLSNPAPAHSSPFNPSTLSSSFGPSPVPASGFNSVLHNPFAPARPQQPVQVLSNPYPPRNFSSPAPQPPTFQSNIGNQHSTTGPSNVVRPSLPQLVNIPQAPQVPMVPSPGNRPMVRQPAFPSSAPVMNVSAANIAPPVSFSSGAPMLQSSNVPNHLAGVRGASVPTPHMGPFSTSTPIQSSIPPSPNAFTNSLHRNVPSSAMTPTLQPAPQFGNVGSFSGTTASFIRSPTAAAPRPQHSGPGDFTFHPHHLPNPASQPVPRLSSQPAAQSGFPGSMMQPPSPQTPSFRMPAPMSTQGGMHVFPRPQVHNEMNQAQNRMPAGAFAGNFTHSSVPSRPPPFPNGSPVAPPVPQMGSRNFSAIPPPPNMAGPFPPRPENSLHFQQNYPPPAAPRGQFMGPNQPFNKNLPFTSGRPASNPGGQHIYDPFSPSSASITSQQRGGNLVKGNKQENDPEYEDLMASVGVK